MSQNQAVLNSQLIFGVKISDEFSAIVEEYNLFSFNKAEDIFFKSGDYSILGVSPPHEEEHNTQHHILFAYEPNIESIAQKPFFETLQELKTMFEELYHKETISSSDYDILIEELKSLHNEKPQLFLFAEDSYSNNSL